MLFFGRSRGLCSGRSEGGDSEVLVTIVVRRRRRSTGEHGCRTFACGHLTCTLASVEDGCEECRIVAQKAEKERFAREKAKQARIETSNILLDLEELRRIKIKSRTVKEILARLAAEAKASSANDNEEPKVQSKAGMKKQS